ncbi:hypothetical protein DSO57_1028019 [Entomophthora muscae]|uniref:Uncharacterized protein n=1 Tax=Entomophthora muscae TaxID=34485 RepID=A0ACC2U070_9FUNG|nr:hypothetical protein DSO57_1028019 [Entomophthora muscae]
MPLHFVFPFFHFSFVHYLGSDIFVGQAVQVALWSHCDFPFTNSEGPHAVLPIWFRRPSAYHSLICCQACQERFPPETSHIVHNWGGSGLFPEACSFDGLHLLFKGHRERSESSPCSIASCAMSQDVNRMPRLLNGRFGSTGVIPSGGGKSVLGMYPRLSCWPLHRLYHLQRLMPSGVPDPDEFATKVNRSGDMGLPWRSPWPIANSLVMPLLTMTSALRF